MEGGLKRTLARSNTLMLSAKSVARCLDRANDRFARQVEAGIDRQAQLVLVSR
jgi:hypothetical protein